MKKWTEISKDERGKFCKAMRISIITALEVQRTVTTLSGDVSDDEIDAAIDISRAAFAYLDEVP